MRLDTIPPKFDIDIISFDDETNSDSYIDFLNDEISNSSKEQKSSGNAFIVMGIIGLVMLSIIAMCTMFTLTISHDTDVYVDESEDSTWTNIASRLDSYGGTIYLNSGSTYSVGTSDNVTYNGGLLKVNYTYYNIDYIQRVYVH